jgi:DNA (cytosine-5)-methyltransferase 1
MKQRQIGQISMTDEIIVDSFAGGGGASTGIEVATGRVVNIAINHDADAILMHSINHPFTEHYQASVWDIDPVEVCKGRPVGLAWFSPDCKHFSKAKGAALVDRKIRGLAWIVLRWAAKVRPRVIMLENVEEFTTWGPVRKGKPVKSLSGTTFLKWKNQLRALGYAIEHRELVAADYGAPTSRKRFVLIARCDGRPIVWPERTHAPADSPEVKSGKCKPWRAAAEIIDWSLPMYSIFDSKEEIKERYGVNAVRPLADNTLRRVIFGTDKYTIKSKKPFFLITTGYGEREGQAPRTHDPEKPLSTVVSTVKQNLAAPIMAPFTFANTGFSVGQSAEKPIGVVRTSGGIFLGAASLVSYHADENSKARVNGLDELLQTVDASNRFGLTMAFLTEHYGNGNPIPLDEPMRTVTSHDREAMLAAHVAVFKGKDKGQNAGEPLRTITAGGGEFGAVQTVIERYDGGRDLGYWPEIRKLLNKYCGYKLAEDEVLLLVIGGVPYYIRDILLRMLAPRELYNAMGFPPDYVIDFIDPKTGKDYPKSAKVARCGNAVCPPMAEAVVRANLPEWCGGKIETMAELRRHVAV